MAIIEENINEKDKKLTGEDRKKIAQRIKSNFDEWNELRQEQIDTAKKIMSEVYQYQGAKYTKDEDNWRSDVHLGKLLCIKRAKVANIWREMWSNPEQMFSVKGTNEETQQNAELQKSSIVDSLNKMNIGKQYDDAMYNLIDVGEAIFFVDWLEKQKTVKRFRNSNFIFEQISRVFNGGKMPQDKITLPYYQNARVRSINPLMFVFDTSNFDKNDFETFDHCQKIWKRFETLENLRANKIYNIPQDVIEDLRLETDKSENENKATSEYIDEDTKGNGYEVLLMHGDIRYNGKLYKNYIAEVLAGKYLIRFEENPLYINPFILCALEYSPITKRGISMLKAPFELCKVQEDLFNTSIDMQKLHANPPQYANDSFFDATLTELQLKPGKVIKVKNGYQGGYPQAVNINPTALDSFVVGVGNSIDNLSSTNNNLNGTVMRSERKATELQLADQGAKTQISKELDTINQDLTVPMIEKVAEVLAMFKDGVDYIFTKEKGKDKELRITNEIRQAQYLYTYEDRNALLEQKGKFQELFQLFQNIAQDPQLRQMCNWRELITTAVELVGFDNSDKFFMPESPLTEIYQQLTQAPQEVQQAVAQQLPMILQQMQMQQQGVLPVNGQQ